GKKVKCPCGELLVAPTPQPAMVPATTPVLPVAQPLTQAFTSANVNVPRTDAHDPALTNGLAPPENANELGRLGKYRVLGVIGNGGMGVVYKAEDAQLKRLVALKAILPSLGASEQIRKRFLREAQAMAKVEHDNVVRLYEI